MDSSGSDSFVIVLGGIWLRKNMRIFMRKADVTENGVNGNKLTFYKAAVPQRNVENRGRCAILYGMYRKQK